MVVAFILNKLYTIVFFAKNGVQIPPISSPVKWLIGLADGLKNVKRSNSNIIEEKKINSFG